MDSGFSRRDLEWIASAWSFPDDVRELGLPLNTVSPATRRALEAIRTQGARQGVLREPGGMTVDAIADVMCVVAEGAQPYRELLDAAPPPDHQAADVLPELRPASVLLDTVFPPLTFAIEPYFPRGELTELVGAHGIFKSTAALGACLSVVTGRPWGSAPVTKGRAVFITLEDTERALACRVRAWLEGVPEGREREAAVASIRESFAYLSREHSRVLPLTETEGRGPTAQRAHVVEHLAYLFTGATLGILETSAKLHGGPELNEALAVFAGALETIASDSGAALSLVRHTSKEGAREGTVDSYAGRGGGALSDAARSVLVMAREGKGAEERDPLAPVRLVHAKSTHTRPGDPIVWRPVSTPHGAYLYALSAAEEVQAHGRVLLAHLATLPEGMSASELHKSPPPGLTRSAARAGMDYLVQTGRVVSTEEERGRNRALTTVYRAKGTP